MSFPTTLRSLRQSRKIGIRELSKRLHHDRAYLSRIENGTVPPSDELVKATARFFKVPERALRIAAGKFPKDILEILSKYPTEAVSILRERWGRITRMVICLLGRPGRMVMGATVQILSGLSTSIV